MYNVIRGGSNSDVENEHGLTRFGAGAAILRYDASSSKTFAPPLRKNDEKSAHSRRQR